MSIKNVNTSLAPFRIVQPHDERAMYTLTEASGDKGMIVKYDGNGFDLNAALSGVGYVNAMSTSFYTAGIAGLVSTRWTVPHKVTAATSGTLATQVAGILLNNVRETDENGESLINHRKNADAREITLSGEAASIARRGFFLVSGVVGTPGPGSGAAVADVGNGRIKVTNPSVVNSGAPSDLYRIGTFVGAKDANGFAPLELTL